MSESNIERTLGLLLAKVDSIEKNQGKADESRRGVHKRLDVLTHEVEAIQSDHASMRSTLADTKAVTDEVRRWKLMGMGALAVVGIGGASLGALGVQAMQWLGHFAKGQ